MVAPHEVRFAAPGLSRNRGWPDPRADRKPFCRNAMSLISRRGDRQPPSLPLTGTRSTLGGMAFNVADLFEHAVDAVPERIAVHCGDRRVTYRELDERANRLAHHLAAHGVGRGDHVGVYSRNSIEAIEAMYAAFKLRAIPVSVNYRYVADEVRYIADNADLVALIHERRYSDIVADVVPQLEKLEQVIVIQDGSDLDYSRYAGVEYEAALAAQSSVRDFDERSSEDIYILYTGGTTGYPKGVVWRHEDAWRALGGGIQHVTGE